MALPILGFGLVRDAGVPVGHLDGPLAKVKFVVVARAQEHQILQRRVSTIDPMGDVVRLAPARGPVATGDDAAGVTDVECAAQPRRDGAGGASQVQRP